MSLQDSGTPDISSDEIRAEAERVLSSSRFAGAERQRRFLEFTINKVLSDQSSEIKEYLIALEVYGRKEDYDPKVDSIVRVEASRVRTRLKEYYEAEGASDPVIIEVPKGSYVPSFRRRDPVAEPVSAATVPDAEAPSPEVPQPAPRRWRHWALAALIPVVAGAGLTLWIRSRSAPPSVYSISIAPFTNLSGDRKADLLAQGLAKEIESEITRSGRLRVVPDRESRSRADVVLEGTVRDDGGKMRVVAQLLSSKDGGYIWSQAFPAENEGDRANELLAKSLARQVEVQSFQYSQELAAAGTPRGRAIALYRAARGVPDFDMDGMLVRGPATIERLELSELNRAISLLEKAVEADPTFAPAYASLASYYQSATEYDSRMLGKARDAARRATELEPRMGEAHATLAYLYFLFDWNLPAAATEFRLSLEFEPRILTSHRMYAEVLTIMGQGEEAIQVLDRARNVYPNHPVVETSVAIALFNSGRFQEAEELARKNLKQFPDFPLSYWILGISLEQLKRYDEALAAVEECLKLSPSDSRCTAAIGHLYGSMGKKKQAREVIARYQSRPVNQSKVLYVQAMIHNALGNRDETYAALEAALANREFDFPYIPVEPRFANLRKQERFQALMRKAGLQFSREGQQ